MATTQVKDWKGRANQSVELQMPSGNVALVRNPGMQAFLQAGIVPNELMPIIMDAIDDKKMPDLDEMKGDPEKLVQILQLVDNILVYCVVEPPVSTVPEGGVTRDPEQLYADEVDMEDKMFIFQFAVGGTKDLETFREQSTAGVESLSAKSAVARPAKRTSGPPAKRRR